VIARVTWGPKVLGRERLDAHRWLIAVEAPFDMSSDITDLIGMRLSLPDGEFAIRGTVPRMPPVRVKPGEPIALLVVNLPA
jgi:hypothetical protein